MIKIILTDDHSIIRDGIRSLLKDEPTIEVVGEASSGNALLELLDTGIEADVVLLDINMPDMDGLEVSRHLAKHYPDLHILILSMLQEEKKVQQLLEAGAQGYLLKSTNLTELVYAIKLVAAGENYIGSKISLNLLNRTYHEHLQRAEATEAKQAAHPTIDNLSNRELEVLKLIGDGLTNAEIADKLFVSKRTVDAHRQKVIEKTNAKNTAALIRYAIEKGLLE